MANPAGYRGKTASKKGAQKKGTPILKKAQNVAATGFGGVGHGLAFLRQIPLIGPIVIAPPIFAMRETVRGHDDRIAMFEAAKAAKARTASEMVKAATKGLTEKAKRGIISVARSIRTVELPGSGKASAG